MSNEKKFRGTPGPWEWDIHDESMASLHGPNHGEDFVMSVSPCSNCIKDKAEWKFGRCMTPSLANARLIAAAPELLEALQAAMDYISKSPCDPDITPLQMRAWQRMRATNPEVAIAKALGE